MKKRVRKFIKISVSKQNRATLNDNVSMLHFFIPSLHYICLRPRSPLIPFQLSHPTLCSSNYFMDVLSFFHPIILFIFNCLKFQLCYFFFENHCQILNLLHTTFSIDIQSKIRSNISSFPTIKYSNFDLFILRPTSSYFSLISGHLTKIFLAHFQDLYYCY